MITRRVEFAAPHIDKDYLMHRITSVICCGSTSTTDEKTKQGKQANLRKNLLSSCCRTRLSDSSNGFFTSLIKSCLFLTAIPGEMEKDSLFFFNFLMPEEGHTLKILLILSNILVCFSFRNVLILFLILRLWAFLTLTYDDLLLQVKMNRPSKKTTTLQT